MMLVSLCKYKWALVNIYDHFKKSIRSIFPYLLEGVETFPRNACSPKQDIATVSEEVKPLDSRNDSSGCETLTWEVSTYQSF